MVLFKSINSGVNGNDIGCIRMHTCKGNYLHNDKYTERYVITQTKIKNIYSTRNLNFRSDSSKQDCIYVVWFPGDHEQKRRL